MLIERIRKEHRGGVVHISGDHYIINQDLLIDRAITLIGHAGTVLEFVGGSAVTVDFSKKID